MKNTILEAVATLSSSQHESSGEVWIHPYQSTVDPSYNQFVVFLKPEATAIKNGVNVDKVVEILLEELARADIEIGAIRAMNSAFLRDHQIMDKHYGVINDISRNGAAAISETARKALDEAFADELRSGALTLGGHQFLARFTSFSAFALSTMSDNMETKKLGSGTYCVSLKVCGERFLVLNAFHPYQLESYTSPGKVIIIFECHSHTSWATLRESVAGATNPINAAEGSIRKIFLERKDELGLPEVSQGTNCIHLSAGPLEGMVELMRFFKRVGETEINHEQTNFGALLLANGLSNNQIERVSLNPSFRYKGKLISAFDLTENVDAIDAAGELVKVLEMAE